MIWILRIIGWLGIFASCFNGYFKLFADHATALQYAGPGRNLDVNISIIAFCLIFLALAAILSEIQKLTASIKGAEKWAAT